MTVPYIFASASATIPLSELDANFATPITLGSTTMILGGTYTTISGLTLTAPVLNNATGDLTGTFKTANFSISESGGKLYFYNGATAIASLDSSGNLTTLAAVNSAGTP